MNIQTLLSSFNGCSCGKIHGFQTKAVEIGAGITADSGSILLKSGFPQKILLVADNNTLIASGKLRNALISSGFIIKEQIFDNLTYAFMKDAALLQCLSQEVEGILAVGSGSIGDLCRLAAYREGKPFAIYATAPSMDGFASDSAPIIENGFKLTHQAKQPEVIIADTEVLAAAPNELKAAGFGDMAAKYTALADWRIANLLTGEYYCPEIAMLVRKGLDKVMSMAAKVTSRDTEAAGSIMEGLVMSGLAMSLAGSSRPASGAEHVLSHFWECKKLQSGKWVEFHGKKTGVAAVEITRLYHRIAAYPAVEAHLDKTDWEAVRLAYGGELADEMMKMNNPTITDSLDPQVIVEKWPQICRIIKETLPDTDRLITLLRTAGAAVEPWEVNVDGDLLKLGMKYHSYMRHRILLTRLLPMISPVENRDRR